MRRTLVGLAAVAACRLPSLDFDDGTFTDTLETITDASLPTTTLDDDADAEADADADATADDTTGDPPPPACGFENSSGAALTWSRTVIVDDVELTTARDVAIDPLGDVVALFEGSGPDGSIDLVVAKYTLDGTLAWGLRWDGDAELDDEAWGLGIDAFADVYVAGGETTSEIESPSGTTIDMRAIVLKVTAAGVPAWRYEHEAPAPALGTSNGRAAAIDANGSAIAVMLGPTWNGTVATEVLVLDRFGTWLSSFARGELGDPVGIEITTSGNLVLAGGAWAGGSQFLAHVAVDGTELWRRLDPSAQTWRALALGPGDEVLVLADGALVGAGLEGTTVHRYAIGGTPIASHVVATYEQLGASTDLAADCAGGVAVSAAQWIDGDEQGLAAHVDAVGTPWSLVPAGADVTGPPSNVAVDPDGSLVVVGSGDGAWLARYVVP
jgi:hypothetical protein